MFLGNVYWMRGQLKHVQPFERLFMLREMIKSAGTIARSEVDRCREW